VEPSSRKENVTPVSFIDAPEGIRADAKKRLVNGVYEAIQEAYPIPDTRILLREWPDRREGVQLGRGRVVV
jgi:hypothetical protein